MFKYIIKMGNNNFISILSLTLGLLLSVTAFMACGSDDDGNSLSNNSSYRISYKGEDNTPYIQWTNSLQTAYLKLEFDEGIPKGSEWDIYNSESWVKIRTTHGKVNTRSENIPVTIEDNTNYEDREAYIYFDVENGLPADASYTTVTIHQYGYEHYLKWGQELSFTTDRSLANDNTLTLNITHMDSVVEVDWGDNIKEVFNENDIIRQLSHQYTGSNNIYRVKLHFGTSFKDGNCSFSFYTERNQGVTEFYNREGSIIESFSDDTKRKYVNYYDGIFTIN